MARQIGNESLEVAQERALATERYSAAVRGGDVERVTYMDRTIEVPKIDHAALGRPVDRQYERNHASVVTRLRAIGVATATVVNFLPILLQSDSCLHPLKPTRCRIQPPKDKQECATFVFDGAFIEPTRQGMDSPLLAFEHHPITLAMEFPHLHPKGVFCFIGVPADLENESWRAKKSPEAQHGGKTYGDVYDDTRRQAIAWMQEMLRRGNDNDRTKIPPTDPQKASARRLFHLGMIKELPLWVEKQRDVNLKIPMCPKCSRPCEPGACQCTNANCGYIIDPRRAYEIGAIGEDDVSLERLTRVDVIEMGISNYVAETRDEKVLRLKTPGSLKPLSLAAQQLQQAEDELKAQQAKDNLEAVAAVVAESRKGNKKEG